MCVRVDRWPGIRDQAAQDQGKVSVIDGHRASAESRPKRGQRPMAVHEVRALVHRSFTSKNPLYCTHRQACGENLLRYGNRMDSAWAMRSAYDEARKLKESQDAYCDKANAGLWESLDGPFPEDLKWEMLVDVLRGRVKVRYVNERWP